METILSSALPAWVLTFLIHSTLLFALAWSLERLLHRATIDIARDDLAHRPVRSAGKRIAADLGGT